MANRRMIDTRIVSSLRFLEMSKSAQALYLHIIANSDDEGVTEAGAVLRVTGIRKKALEELIDSGFVTVIEPKRNVVYTHNWHKFNHVDARYGQTSYYHRTLEEHFPNIEFVDFMRKPDDFPTSDSRIVESSRKKEKRSNIEVESGPESDINTARMTSTHGGFFMESCPDVLKSGMHNLVCQHGDTPETRLMSVVTIKLFRLEIWKPDTCFRLAKRFTELNSNGLSRKWKDDKWQNMLEGFVESEQTGSDYDEWMENCEDGDELPFG